MMNDDNAEIHLSKIDPFAGIHVDLTESILDNGKPGMSLYVYRQYVSIASDPVEIASAERADEFATGNVRRLAMVADWICRFINSGGHPDHVVILASQIRDYIGEVVTNEELVFLGHKLILPPEGYLPSNRDVDPYSPFVYYVCTEGYDVNNILEVHENKSAVWIDYADLDV